MSPAPHVVFIGPPASGKTRLGKRVAKRLGVRFLDTDKLIVAEHGPIVNIFEEHGEPYYRELERRYVARALTEDAVVSLGGGAVLDEETQRDLARLRVVRLTVSPEAVLSRITGPDRPLVTGIDAWLGIYEARRHLYDRFGKHTWDTSSGAMDEIAAEIVEWIEQDRA